jgi:hypothetical protein
MGFITPYVKNIGMPAKQGDLTGAPADNPESPFAADETDETDDRSESVDRPESNHTFADYGSSGQKTLAGFDE